ncbi:MAG: serine/threonine protein phosphatase [Clostridiales bacterium]|nr:serine/threonine protein phosphatase [Clostridiales bacterium]
MATYVLSDIHGQYDLFTELLEKIQLKKTDTLYILGDALDRGPHPIRTLRKIMDMPNAVFLAGNHEQMAGECLQLLMTEITPETLLNLDRYTMESIINWRFNGSSTTIAEFSKLCMADRQAVLDFISEAPLYKELQVGDTKYLMVHAGLGNYDYDKPIEDYTEEELLWSRADYNTCYYDDVYVVTGHTPTQAIAENPDPGYIFRKNNHIAIDCGAYLPSGRLAAICLDTGEEYYSSSCSAKASKEMEAVCDG